jgi:hypothetical protein
MERARRELAAGARSKSGRVLLLGEWANIRRSPATRKAPQGNVFFAGEHCSADYQGFMEGGAAEGARAAKEILDRLRGSPTRKAPPRRSPVVGGLVKYSRPSASAP